MPTYSYRCIECGNAFDIQQAFTDDSLTECPVCGGVLRKVFSPIGVSFTGSGFYRNDSREKPAKDSDAGSSSEARPEPAKTDAAKSEGAGKNPGKKETSKETSKKDSQPPAAAPSKSSTDSSSKSSPSKSVRSTASTKE